MPNVRGTIEVDVETCKGCELCIEACPQESIELSKNINAQGYHYAVLVRDNCTGCVNCALVCPDAVITVYRTVRKQASGKPSARAAVAVISNVKGNMTVTVGDDGGEGGGR